MNAKTLIILVVVAVAAVTAAMWITSERSGEAQSSVTSARLLPGLEQNINEVNLLRVVKAGDEVVAELKPAEHGWVVASKYDYPAAIGEVRQLLLSLAEAEIIEQKTAKAEYYDRLGVQDVSNAEATGVQLDLEGVEPADSLIIGDTATGGREGTYVRRKGEDTSFLIGTSITVPKDTRDWLERAIIDIPASDIQRVAIHHPDGATLMISKDSREQSDFTVADIPESRELNGPTAANSLAGTLTSVTLEDVLPSSEMDPSAHQGVTSEYHGFDGLTVTAKAFTVDDKRYVHFGVGFDEEQAQRFAKPEKAATDNEKTATAEKAEQTPDAAKPVADGEQAETKQDDAKQEDIKQKAANLEARLSPWVYVISSYKQDLMAKRMDDLLKPLGEPAKEPASEPQVENPTE